MISRIVADEEMRLWIYIYNVFYVYVVFFSKRDMHRVKHTHKGGFIQWNK